MDQSVTVGSIDLPMNGVITFNGDMEVTFDDATTGDRTWNCKTNDQLSSACPTNYLVDGLVPDTPPCANDSIVIGDSATQILWVPGQFVANIVVSDTTYANDDEFKTGVWDMSVGTDFLGSPPNLNAETGVPPAAMCINTCPVHDLTGTISVDDRFSPAGMAELARLATLRDAVTAARTAATAAFTSDDMMAQLNILQQEYTAEYRARFTSENQAWPVLVDGAVTMPEVVVGGGAMGDWLESAGMPDQTAINTIKYMTTKKVTDRAMGYVNAQVLTGTVIDVWTPVTSVVVATAAAESLNNGITDLDPDTATGQTFTSVAEVAPTEDNGFTEVDKRSFKTLLAFAAPQAAADRGPGRVSLSEPFKFIRPENTTWGKAVATSLDPQANFDYAPGAVSFVGVQIESKTFVDTDGVLKSAVAPKVLEYLASSAVVQMALYNEEIELSGHVSRATALTFSPTASPVPDAAASTGDEESSTMMMIIIAAAAGLVLCIIIVVVVVRMGGSSDGVEKDSVGRGVVSFENPMYDDPSAGDAAPDEDGGLYDEPAFNADGKENPMYASNDNTAAAGGGYLDVEPDDGDEDSDEDSEDDE